jgi:hypothetical protein
MLEKNENPGKPPIFSEKRIAEVTKLFKDKIAEVMRLQRAGKLPFYKKIPKAIVRTSDIKIIMNVLDRQAQRIMAQVRAHAGKTKKQYITINDFHLATGIDEFTIQRVLDACT